MRKICDLMGGEVSPILGAIPDRPRETTRRARSEETRRVLGWAPSTKLGDGLRRTIDWHVTQASRAEAEVLGR